MDVGYGDYYLSVYDEETINSQINTNSTCQFTISYGNKHGYGSVNGQKSTSITKAIYTQYKNILLGLMTQHGHFHKTQQLNHIKTEIQFM